MPTFGIGLSNAKFLASHFHGEFAATNPAGGLSVRHFTQNHILIGRPLARKVQWYRRNAQDSAMLKDGGSRPSDAGGHNPVHGSAQQFLLPFLPRARCAKNPAQLWFLTNPSLAHQSLDFRGRLGSQELSGGVNSRFFGRPCHLRIRLPDSWQREYQIRRMRDKPKWGEKPARQQSETKPRF
jgi:hypothetical protein